MGNKKIGTSHIIKSLIWKFTEKTGVQGIQLFLQIILARILMPEDFGLIIIVTVFVTIANTIIQNGFTTALIQKNNPNKTDYTTVFWINMTTAIIIYSFLYSISSFLANLFGYEDFEPVLKVLGITLFIGAIISIQIAIMTKRMDFKNQFFVNIISVIISGIIGIYLAINEYGVWAIVFQQIFLQILQMIFFFRYVKWFPDICFSKNSAVELFDYGWKILLSSLLDVVYNNSRTLIIGKMYDASSLAYYSRGEQFPSLIVGNINGSIQSVMFPTFVSHNNDLIKLKAIVRETIKLSCFLVFPIMAILAAVAEPLVILLMTEKWVESVIYIQIACVYIAFWPLHTTNLQAVNALGRSDLFLKAEIVKKAIGVIILIISIPYGIIGIAIGMIISGLLATFINSIPVNKLLGYSYKSQILDVLPTLICSLIVFGLINCLGNIAIGDLSKLFLQFFSGLFIYIMLARILKIDTLNRLTFILRRQF